MMKAILFGLVECEGPGFCNHIGRFGAILGPGPSSCPADKAGVQLLTFESFWRARRAQIEILANEAQKRSDKAKRIPVLRDTTLFKTWLPNVPSQHSTRVRSIRAAVKDSCRERNLPPRVPERILLFLCSKHERCSGRDLDGCESIYWGHHEDQPTEEEFCAFIAREVVTNLDLSAEARRNTGKKQNQMGKDKAVVDEDDVGVDRDPEAGAGENFIFEAVGGDADVDFCDEINADPGIEWQPYYPLKPMSALAVALRLKENQAVLASVATKRGTVDQKAIAAYINQSGKLLSEKYPLSPDKLLTFVAEQSGGSGTSARNTHLGTTKTKNVGEALDHQLKVLILMRKPGGHHKDTIAQDYPADDPSISGANRAPLPRELIPLPDQCCGPGPFAWALLQHTTCSEDQIDFASLPVLTMQQNWQQVQDRDATTDEDVPLALQSTSSTCRMIGLGGGGCGKSYVLEKVIEPTTAAFYGQQGYLAVCQSNAGAQNVKGRTCHTACSINASQSMKVEDLKPTPAAETNMALLLNKLGCLGVDELSQIAGALLHCMAYRFTFGRARAHKLRREDYMRLPELFGRIDVVCLLGDFLQLPPVPSSASLSAKRRQLGTPPGPSHS